MKVKCINQKNFKNITEGNEYEVISESQNLYTILNNSESSSIYSKKYFEVITEPIIEDIDETGVVEEEVEFTVDFDEDEENIEIHIGDSMAMLTYYQVASNCGVHSYHGVNNLYECCDEDEELFKKIIKEVIELLVDSGDCCMFILSTNSEYKGIWTVLDEIMDTKSEVVENPNSELDVKLWIKYTN